MVDPTIRRKSLSRREFIYTSSAGAAALALASGNRSPVEASPSSQSGAMRRNGISEPVYRKAWQRAAAMVAKMTLAEKIAQTGNNAPAIKRLSLSAYNYYSGEALHGLMRGGPVTSFPLPLAMVCSWNPTLALAVYTAVSDEARAYNKKENVGLAYYSPQTLNLHRDPRWGRCEEAPGEDPCLASTWAIHVIRGMQGDDSNYLKTTACAKHFICNNTDNDRTGVSASVDPRNFWEYYTRAYRACALDADVFTFMSAYSAINGIPCSADRFLLTSLLRDRWGFRGYVTSDCDAVDNIFNPHHYVPTLHQAAAVAIQAGCDLNCGDTMPKHLGKAVKDQLVSEADISRAVTRLLTVRVLFGEYDSPESVPYNRISFDVVDSAEHRELALNAARQSIVLLKNDNNFLPLQKSALKTVAVIGPTAGQCHLGGYSGSPFVHISPYAGIAEALGAKIYNTREHVWPDQLVAMSSGVQTQSSSEGGMNIDWIGDGAWVEYKPQDFSGKNRIAIRAASPSAGAVIHVHIDSLNTPAIAKLNVPKTGDWQNWTTLFAPIGGVVGRHSVFFKFSGVGLAICNMEWFQLQPFVSPPVPQPKLGKPAVIFKPGCTIEGGKDDKMFAEAVQAAKSADVVIMVCGVNQSVDSEGHDRKDINFTGVQHELIQACYKANPKTVLVLSSNNTVAVNWEHEHLPAIVSAVFAGQAQGTAIADVLFGNYNPGGKTCCTWYKSLDQLPPFHNYDIIPNSQKQPSKPGQVSGRTYMYFVGEPLYPFGYGLSYTQFKFSDLKINTDTLSEDGSVQASARITNIGNRDGAEVAQFYITAPKSPVKRPIKQLVGFQRLELKAGESKTVTFTLPYNEQALWYWHENQRKFVLQPGQLKLMIGSSSADIHLRGAVILAASNGASGGPESLTSVALRAMVK